MSDSASDSASVGTPSFHLLDTDSEVIVANHHLPPSMASYVFVRHLRSAISHDTFLAYRTPPTDSPDKVRESLGRGPSPSEKSAATTCRSRSRSGSHTGDSAKDETAREYVVIRVYAHEYLKRDVERRQMVERDALVSRIIRHPHIAASLPSFASSTDVFTVQRHYKGGELYEVMESYAESVAAAAATSPEATSPGGGRHAHSQGLAAVGHYGLPESIAKRLARELLQALSYLHNDCGLAHRNLKLENVFLDADNHVHLAGFGMCAVLPKKPASSPALTSVEPHGASAPRLKLCCGSKHYIAPELVQGEAYDGCAVDVWAAGVILFALLTGAFPFDTDDGRDEGIFRKIRQGTKALEENPLFRDLTDPMAQDILRSMLRVDPAARCDALEALSHPFFAS